MKKKLWLNLICLSSFSFIPSIIISCSNKNIDNETTDMDKIKFESAFNNFNLVKKQDVDLSRVYAKQITNEKELLKYFDLSNKDNDVEYKFISSNTSNQDKSTLNVVYELKYKNNTKNKDIILKGFAIEQFDNPSLSKEELNILKEKITNLSFEVNPNILPSQATKNDINFINTNNQLPDGVLIDFNIVKNSINDDKGILKIEFILNSGQNNSDPKQLEISGFSNRNKNQDKIEFEEAFNKFDLKKKQNIDLSQKKSFEIDNEEKLLNLFTLENTNQNIDYKFILTKTEFDPNKRSTLVVKYLLTSRKNEQLTSIKTLKINGFNDNLSEDEIEFEEAFMDFRIYKKNENTDLSQILASEINNENAFKKYFDDEQQWSGYLYNFISAKVDNKDISKLIVEYKITSETNQTLTKNKVFIFSGFKNPNVSPPTIDQIKEKNKKIVQKILNLLRIEKIKNNDDISARDFLLNYTTKNFESYFKLNKDDILDLNLTQEKIDFPATPSANRIPNELNSILFTFKVSVGKGETYQESKISIKVDGFKSLLSDIDKNPSNSISPPPNAKSYKGFLEPVIFHSLGEDAYKDRIYKKFTFEQLKMELMYQLRFWMYQMFSDNFSEIDYWIEQGNMPGDKIIAKIEGIVKSDVENVEYWAQQLGNIKKSTDSLKTGDKITITLDVLDSQNWRPKGSGVFGFIDKIDGFSFEKGCQNINFALNGDKGAYATILPTSSFNISINGNTKISESRWVNFGSVMFTVGATRGK